LEGGYKKSANRVHELEREVLQSRHGASGGLNAMADDVRATIEGLIVGLATCGGRSD
jgi:hypothetical protein